MDQQKQLEQLVLTSIDTAKAMLEEYEVVVPFGVQAFFDSEDIKMHCPGAENPKAGWDEQIALVTDELHKAMGEDNLYAAGLVTALESEDGLGIGLQIKTKQGTALFVYPYHKQDNNWIIEEPVQSSQLLTVF